MNAKVLKQRVVTMAQRIGKKQAVEALESAGLSLSLSQKLVYNYYVGTPSLDTAMKILKVLKDQGVEVEGIAS